MQCKVDSTRSSPSDILEGKYKKVRHQKLGKNIAQENKLSEAYRGYLQLNLTLEKLCLEVRLNEFKYAECGKDFVTFLALTRNQFCEIEPSLFAGSPDTGQRLTEQGAQLVLAQQPGKTQSPPWKATVL